jgi:hypothetical protein
MPSSGHAHSLDADTPRERQEPPTAVDPARRLNVCFGVAATIGC